MLGLSLGLGLTGPVRADETVRQVQEELRKRNLYFGDVDGTLSSPTAAALRRYQQRKGFPVTGELDAITLDSLMIPVPPGLAARAAGPLAPAAQADPPAPAAMIAARAWPDVTVLRSDEGRRQPPPGDDQPPTPPPATPVPPPPARASQQHLSTAEARAFIERYLAAGQANDPAAELAYYGERVEYFNEGLVDRRFIRADIARYDHRWPERHFTLLEPFTVLRPAGGDPRKTVVNFRYRFLNKGGKYLVQGKTENTWTLAGDNPADTRIVALKEQRVRE